VKGLQALSKVGALPDLCRGKYAKKKQALELVPRTIPSQAVAARTCAQVVIDLAWPATRLVLDMVDNPVPASLVLAEITEGQPGSAEMAVSGRLVEHFLVTSSISVDG
jgi:hypothetical protein